MLFKLTHTFLEVYKVLCVCCVQESRNGVVLTLGSYHGATKLPGSATVPDPLRASNWQNPREWLLRRGSGGVAMERDVSVTTPHLEPVLLELT